MSTHYISFRKKPARRSPAARRLVRLEFVISRCSRRQARQFVRQECERLQLEKQGYAYQGVN